MSLDGWLSEGRIKKHHPTTKEIAGLLQLVERDLSDALTSSLSSDRRFSTGYNAILQLSTVVVRAAGYRTGGPAHHWVTFQLLPEILGRDEQERTDYFDSCRTKRNTADYDYAGMISETEVVEILREADLFKSHVLAWLRANHPTLCSEIP